MSPVALLFVAAVSAGSSGSGEATAPSAPRVALDTSKGRIVLELDAARAPKTVENFLAYVRDGHYDGTVFHRVIDGFMVQGGGFTAEMQQKPTRPPVANEADNGLKNLRGTVAMARTNDPHSASAQFFVNTVDNSFLDHTSKDVRGWGYAVFGKVVEGMEVVDAITKVRTATRSRMENVPVEPVVITRATVLP
jgi:cyclophilin family peptidyl-prolyl cis-trans isomerase